VLVCVRFSVALFQVEMKIVATFLYNGDPVFPSIVDYIYDYVDEIVVVESLVTFSGNRKESYYFMQNANYFVNRDKIKILQVPDIPRIPEHWNPFQGMPEQEKPAWFREFFIRDLPLQYIMENMKDDIDDMAIVFADADEMIHVDVLKSIRQGTITEYKSSPLFLQMEMFYYNFNWHLKKKWSASFVSTPRFLATRSPSYIRIQDRRESVNVLPNAGWHCTNFSSCQDIKRKIDSFSHQDLNTPEINNLNHIRTCVLEGKDVFNNIALGGRDTTLVATKLEELHMLPSCWPKIHYLMISLQNANID